jgi:hypothetical protein
MMSMTQEIDQNVIHDEFIRLIKTHDYSYMYSEDNDVWAKAKASMNSIGSMLGVLVGVCRIDPQELLDECLGMYTNEGDYHNLVRSEIKKWFKPYEFEDLGPEYDSAGFTEEDRIVDGQYRVVCEHSFIDINNDGLEQCRFCNEQNK